MCCHSLGLASQKSTSCKSIDQGAWITLADKFGSFLMQPKLSKYPGASLPLLLQGSKKLFRIFQDSCNSLQKWKIFSAPRELLAPSCPGAAKALGGKSHPAASTASGCSTACLSFPLSRSTNNHSRPLKGLRCLWVHSILPHTKLQPQVEQLKNQVLLLGQTPCTTPRLNSVENS